MARGLRTRSFSEAKAHLSEVVSEVVRTHAPTVIERHGGREQVVLLDPEALRPLLARFAFTTKAAVSDGEYVLRLPEFGLVAGGETFDQAIAELEALAVDHAQDLLARYDFFRHTERAEHLPHALRLLLAAPGERRAMLVPAPPAAA